MSKSHINLTVDSDVWRAFRIACLERGAVAGRVLETFMQKQLARWAKEKTK
jgi:hypothetical protein